MMLVEKPDKPRVEANRELPADWTFGRCKTNGINLSYRRIGSGPPLMLLHGWPQHSLMWHAVGPLLADRYTVIAPDLRGAGSSAITASGYDKATMAADVVGLCNQLGFEDFFLVGYDLGAGVAAALARQSPARVRRLAVMEFGLAGFGFEQAMAPQADWTLYSNWHLSLFSVPDAAVWLLTGRERELLSWFFYHASYKGNAGIDPAHFEAYARELVKPGALRAGIGYYASVWQDAKDNAPLATSPLAMPVLALGGEASAGPVIEQIWSPIASDLTVANIPQAGHWLCDENPLAVATALGKFFDAEPRKLAALASINGGQKNA
jgi:pimeloyl-ACP methyl ester carboxylesterase